MTDGNSDPASEIERPALPDFARVLLEASGDLHYACDLHGRVLYANPAVARLLGRPLADILGARREALMPLRDAIAHELADQEVASTGRMQVYCEELHGGPTEPRYYLSRKFPLRDGQGRIIAIGGTSTDITHERIHDRMARMSEALFQHSSEAMILTDAETRIQRVNPAFTRLSGFTERAVLGHKTRILKSGRQTQAFYSAMWQQLSDTDHWEGELTNRSAGGQFYTVWCSINALRGALGAVEGYMAIQTNLTRLRAAESQLARLTSFDELTELPNRVLLRDRMTQRLLQAEQHEREFAVLFLDLDHFKAVNDTFGRAVGDELLRQVARRLLLQMRAQDTAARLGGDEFVLLLPDAGLAAAQAVARRVVQALTEPVDLPGASGYRPQASVGIAVYPADGQSVELLMRNADTAMHAAKLGGRNRVERYTPEMSVRSARLFGIQAELAAGITRGELRLWLQSRVQLATGELIGAEALVRWMRPAHGLIGPADFLPALGAGGLIVELDTWMFREAAQRLRGWIDAGLWRPGWRLSLNLSAGDLRGPGRVEQLRAILDEVGVEPAIFEFEITEEALLEPSTQVLETLKALRALGFALSIDDFGTGYSSLAYLKRLPVNGLKIDQSFIRDMLDNERDRALVESIILLSSKLGLECTAEGVETEAQRQFLVERGCARGQGYLYCKPMDAADFARSWLQPLAEPIELPG